MNNVNILLQTVEAEQKRSSADHATLNDKIHNLHATALSNWILINISRFFIQLSRECLAFNDFSFICSVMQRGLRHSVVETRHSVIVQLHSVDKVLNSAGVWKRLFLYDF